MQIEQQLRFAKTLAGIYDNYEQAQSNPKDFARINIVFRPLPWEIFEGPGFYSEQYYDYAKWNPYRQGIHRLKIKDQSFVVENFDFGDKERLAGSSADCSASLGTTMQNPIPMLNVCHRSRSGIAPAD